MNRARSCLSNLLVFGLGMSAALALGEVFLRSTGLGSPSTIERHGRLPFKRRPLAKFVNREERTNTVVLNNWGFHDRHRRARKDGYRVVAFGDSFVEGNQVAVEELFTSRIEADLRRRRPRAEVVNAGVGGVGTAYEYLLYKEFFEGEIELDHVLLFIYNGNDLANNHPALEQDVNGNEVGGKVYLNAAGEVRVEELRLSRRQELFRFLDRHSALIYTLHRWAYRLKSRNRREDASRDDAERGGLLGRPAAWKEAVDGTLRLIERWNRELVRRGIAFSVVVIPEPHGHADVRRGGKFKAEFAERLKALAAGAGFPVLELSFGTRGPLEVYSFDGRTLGHFNHLGHRLSGRQVSAWLGSRL